MVVIPPELKRECEPDSTKYGKFIKRYHLHKRVKSSPINHLIQTANLKLSSMSKLRFLEDYLLNEEYILDDFLNVQNASLRGFLYEAIWDVCIKCDVVPTLDRGVAYHMNGKIEAPANENFYIAALAKKFDRLEVVSDLYAYLAKNKVQSGNTGGISDITLRLRDDPNAYVLISCKYYLNEKAIMNYDIAAIQHAMKHHDTVKSFEIVLLVADKAALLRKIQKSHKRHTKASMKRIFDEKDLRVAFGRLRQLFGTLRKVQAATGQTDKKLFKGYFAASTWKPLAPTDFHGQLWRNLALGTDRTVMWNSCMPNALRRAVVFAMSSEMGKRYAIVCDAPAVQAYRKALGECFEGAYVQVRFHTRIEEADDGQTDVVFVHTCLDRMRKASKCGCVVIALCDDVLSSTGPNGIKFNMEDHIALRSDATSSAALRAFPEWCVERASDGYDAAAYQAHGEFHAYTNASRRSTDTTQDVIEFLFGKENALNERYVMFNRLAGKTTSIKAGKVSWIASNSTMVAFEEARASSPYLAKRTAEFDFVFGTDPDTLPTDATVVIASLPLSRLPFDTLYKYLNRCFDSSNEALVLVELDPPRLELLASRFDLVADRVFDPDMSRKQLPS
jgi:hypothetical protein